MQQKNGIKIMINLFAHANIMRKKILTGKREKELIELCKNKKKWV